MHILIASDHAGYDLKNTVADTLRSQGYEVTDMGDSRPDSEDDYPDFVMPLAQAVAKDSALRGIVLGGSGQGEAMAANRVKGIRAAVYYGFGHAVSETGLDTACQQPLEILKLSREHNNANVLSLGARFLTEDGAKEAVALWLATPFSGDERHIRRNAKLDQ